MSSLIYGIVTAKRSAAPAGQSQSASAPGMGTYVDTLVALVPAEALALYAGFVVPYTTQTASVHGKNVTVINDPKLLQWSCVGLLALSSLLYFVGRQRVMITLSDLPRAIIPPAAFAGWMLVQNPGVWDIWWPGSTLGDHTVVAVFGAVVLGVGANLLGRQADGAAGTLAVTAVSPGNGSVTGGTRVTLTGSGFSGAKEVKFGPAAGTHLTINTDGELTVTSPQGDEPGPVDVVVADDSGTSPTSAADHFTYTADAAAATRPNGAGATPPNVAEAVPPSGAGATPPDVAGSGPAADGDHPAAAHQPAA